MKFSIARILVIMFYVGCLIIWSRWANFPDTVIINHYVSGTSPDNISLFRLADQTISGRITFVIIDFGYVIYWALVNVIVFDAPSVVFLAFCGWLWHVTRLR